MSSIGELLRGQCKWFNVHKGYGFIERPNAEDVFVHNASIKHSKYRVLYTGEPVEFRTRISSTGRLEACDVTGPGGSDCSGSLLPKTARKYRCYNCGQFAGHLSRECPWPQATQQLCYICQSTKHRRSQCPQKQKETKEVTKDQKTNPSDSGIDLDISTDSSVLSAQTKTVDPNDVENIEG